MLALHVFCEQLLDHVGGTHMVNIFAPELQLLEADMELFFVRFYVLLAHYNSPNMWKVQKPSMSVAVLLEMMNDAP